MKAELCGVAFDERILPVEVGNHYELVAKFVAVAVDQSREEARVEIAVGVLLQHVEARHVKVVTVVGELAEEATAQIEVVEDEAAKVAVELLNARAQKGRIEIGALALLAAFTAQEGQQL